MGPPPAPLFPGLRGKRGGPSETLGQFYPRVCLALLRVHLEFDTTMVFDTTIEFNSIWFNSIWFTTTMMGVIFTTTM
ncbi:MAG: hypothetical protein ABID40_00645 [Candidatus Bipolaricaulota bacterium]